MRQMLEGVESGQLKTMKEPLTIMGKLKGVVQRLSDVGKIWTKGELGYDMRQVHLYGPKSESRCWSR